MGVKPSPKKGQNHPKNPRGVIVVILLFLLLLPGPYGHNTYKPSSEVAEPPAPVGDGVTSIWGGSAAKEPQF